MSGVGPERRVVGDGLGGGRRLGELLAAAGLPPAGPVAGRSPSGADASVCSVEYDSRRVTDGALFVAIRGLTVDGHGFVAEAAGRGAVAALVEAPTGAEGLAEIVCPDTREALGLVAHEFYGRPSEKMKTHGITGTNGKTTTSYLVDSILRRAGLKTGVVGTLGYRVGDRAGTSGMTSPESLDLARILAEMVEAGVEAVTMEVSSHALALGRTAGMRFDTAALTNLSRDHLDFHESIESYAAAKRSLFERLADRAWKSGSTAVVNVDDQFGREMAGSLASGTRVGLVTYGWDEGDVSVVRADSTPSGTSARFRTPVGEFETKLRLISSFNVMNALAATAIAVSQGTALDAVAAGLADTDRVEGRLETVDAGQDFTIVVDYAHTPDALEKALAALRALGPGRLITVFGCGGDRDRGKRPMMGEIAAAGSDYVVVTSDNPRTEDPAAIIDEIMTGAGSASGRGEVVSMEDRRSAIAHAIARASAGDIVLIAGKGHEDYQIIGTEKVHFDDREEAAGAVRLARSGRGNDGEGSAH
jgi:UDP-N-acetylmuramoyl-L-alanyl-D-glutamate--2,6-diaminopimelate ligase